jgi:hypothetical protein
MVSRMTIFYELQTTQVNEKLPLESSLDLTLMQHPCDEDPKLQEVRPCFEIEPPRVWYYCISLNSHTLVILLQVDLAFGDEFETIYEGCYETEDIFIFSWFSIISVGHYRWLCGPIR